MYPGPSFSSFGSAIAVSQVVVEVVSRWHRKRKVVLKLGFSTLGVMENSLIEALSVLPFELPPAL